MTRHAYREGIPVGKGRTKLARRRGECGGGSERVASTNGRMLVLHTIKYKQNFKKFYFKKLIHLIQT